MLPHQAQGLGTAIEDAGSLGLLFGDDFLEDWEEHYQSTKK
jgi:hypothetical protein